MTGGRALPGRAARWPRSWAGGRSEQLLAGRRRANGLERARSSVLVDNGTAGPGEIVAAALLDAGRAKLVGEHTFGRAAVSKTVPLPEGGLVLTVAKYMSPEGTSIHGEGLRARRSRCAAATTRTRTSRRARRSPTGTASSRRRSRS